MCLALSGHLAGAKQTERDIWEDHGLPRESLELVAFDLAARCVPEPVQAFPLVIKIRFLTLDILQRRDVWAAVEELATTESFTDSVIESIVRRHVRRPGDIRRRVDATPLINWTQKRTI
jgi:hypothetical protein